MSDENVTAQRPALSPALRAQGNQYPICPQCGCNTIVMYAPPREGLVGTAEGYRLFFEKNWGAYVDWNRAHLYCCNAETDCKVEMPIIGGLTTPVKEARYSAVGALRAAIVEARRRLAKGRALWNGPCHECDAVLAQALELSEPRGLSAAEEASSEGVTSESDTPAEAAP